MVYLITFMEGVITFISPCLLPMLPIYVFYFVGDEHSKDKKVIWLRSSIFVLGFSLVFTLLGAFAGSLGSLLQRYQIVVNLVTGAIVIVFGLSFLGIIKLSFLKIKDHGPMDKHKDSWLSIFVLGIIFALGWTPCVGAFLGSALLLASHQGSTLAGMVMLLVYSIGLGIPFVLSAVLIDHLKSTFDLIKKHYNIINTISGLILIIMGVLMASGLLGRFLAILSF
ncbi:MAG: cytochrome c biogenesis protein CcdA [Erysipelotrichaceae bacterium]|nr:cytochrome c biogenesis protein CcdA [Erysipelotrichaceae bacterium]